MTERDTVGSLWPTAVPVCKCVYAVQDAAVSTLCCMYYTAEWEKEEQIL